MHITKEDQKQLSTIQTLKSLKFLLFFLFFIFFLGLIFFSRKNKLNLPPQTQTQQPLFLSLNQPLDGEIVFDSTVSVRGQTVPNATVLVYTEKGADSIESDASGVFESTINLATGLNQLTVAAFSENEEQGFNIDVINDNYPSQVKGEKSGKEEAPGQKKKPEQTAPQEPQSQQIQTPPEQQTKKEEPAPQAIVGNVSQVTESSVIVEEKKSKTNVETKVNKETPIINQESKSIKLNTVQKNDAAAIIPKGKMTTSTETVSSSIPYTATTAQTSVIEADKIYVKENSEQLPKKRHADEGVITRIEDNRITLTHQIQADRSFVFFVNNDTVVKIKGISNANISHLAVGQRIAVVGDLDSNGFLLAKLIHVIKNTTLATSPTPLTSLTPTKTPTASPSLSTTPSPTPTVIDLTPTLTETPPTITATPTPTVAPCELTVASWITNTNPVTEGTIVQLNVAKTGVCDGQQVTFEVIENDSLLEGGIDDPAIIQPAPITFPLDSEQVQGTWSSEWQDDCLGLCNPPEYFFTATLVDGNSVRSADPLLIVNPIALPAPTPTPTPTVTPTAILTPSPSPISSYDISNYVLGADGSTCYDSDGNSSNYLKTIGYCQDNSGVYSDFCGLYLGSSSYVDYSCRDVAAQSLDGGVTWTYNLPTHTSCAIIASIGAGTCPVSSGPSPTPLPTFSTTTNSDIIPPYIKPVSPLPGSTVKVGEIIPFEANVTDNVAVAKVDFFALGKYIGTVTQPPYRVMLDTSQFSSYPYSYGFLDVVAWDTTGLSARTTDSFIYWKIYIQK